MDKDLNKEIDEEIKRILNLGKKEQTKKVRFCNKENLKECLSTLIQEFDNFDVCCMDEDFQLNSKSDLRDIVIQLVNSSYHLIKLQKETLKNQSDINIHRMKNVKDLTTLQKSIKEYQKEIAKSEKELKKLKEENIFLNTQIDGLKNKLGEEKRKISLLNKQTITDKQNKSDLEKTERSFNERILHYVENNSYGEMITIIQQLKQKDKKQTDIITKLQSDNHALLEEFLILENKLKIAIKKSAEK